MPDNNINHRSHHNGVAARGAFIKTTNLDTGVPWDKERTTIVNLILLFWFLRIFKPEWIISFYLPGLSFTKSIPTGLLLLFLIYLVFSGKKPHFDKPMLFFSLAIFISTVFSVNMGMSANILRWTVETLLIYSLACTFVISEKSIRRFFIFYLLSCVLFGLWGIAGGGRVAPFMPLSDEDSFGPFMVIGAAIAYFILQSKEGPFMRRLSFLSFFICLGGVLASSARGTFLTMIFMALYIFVRTENKARFVARVVVFAILCLVLALTVVPPQLTEKYFKLMGTITTEARLDNEIVQNTPQTILGHSAGTGRDRYYLWSRAFSMFLDNPLLGVGPGCYGFKLQSYITRASAEEWRVRYQMYGRAIHNIYFELLAETGIMGISAFLVLLYIFRRRNVSIRKTAARVATDALGNVHCYALALEGAMIAFLANGFFYNLLYYSWFWDILILNTLLYQRVRTIEHAAIDER